MDSPVAQDGICGLRSVPPFASPEICPGETAQAGEFAGPFPGSPAIMDGLEMRGGFTGIVRAILAHVCPSAIGERGLLGQFLIERNPQSTLD